jgi:hypothetical protein
MRRCTYIFGVRKYTYVYGENSQGPIHSPALAYDAIS